MAMMMIVTNLPQPQTSRSKRGEEQHGRVGEAMTSSTIISVTRVYFTDSCLKSFDKDSKMLLGYDYLKKSESLGNIGSAD
mmetsp:Transcript_3110/g.3867  ORF Transcript_3110/g.3867 Transcript_3110/m.3867 type:complete len:80 (-) Transcript_3110:315-554(-)